MTATPILETLARECSASIEHVQNALEMLDAGLCAPFIGRFRRAQVGGLSESFIRRLDRRRHELEELDRRRGTILRLLEREPGVGEHHLAAIRACMDRFELEDLFIPHRRPEPEVQLALDRGLGALADLLTTPVPKSERAAIPGMETSGEDGETDGDLDEDEPRERAPSAALDVHATEAEGDSPAARPGEPALDAGVHAHAPESSNVADGAATGAALADAPVAENVTAKPGEADGVGASALGADGARAEHSIAAGDVGSPAEPRTDFVADAALGSEPDAPADSDAEDDETHAPAPTLDAPRVSHAHIDLRTAMNAHLARMCQPFVRPDKGIHTESEALSGALRILSDRLGRDPRLRGAVRRILSKHGVLSVRPTVDEGRMGRHRSLLKTHQPLRQLQGHRLLAIRQAQKERLLNTVITLDPAKAVPKVRSTLGRYTHPACVEVLHEVAVQALNYRLLPMVEQDVRLELKERADSEALRFLSQHLRQILFTPWLGRQAVAGIDVSAKGDWTVAVLDADGNPVGSDVKIEVGAKDAATLGAELDLVLAPHDVHYLAVGHGKGPRAALNKLRSALRAPRTPVAAAVPAGSESASAPSAANAASATLAPQAAPSTGRTANKPVPFVFIVNESGLSSYANSELARHELEGRSVPARMAISLGRRLQDPLSEVLKVDPRHLGLGSEQGLVSKANARRAFVETVESCTAHVGCDVNRCAPTFLQHLPGIDRETAKKIVARRAERPFQSREELRADGLLSEAQWTSAVAFLRVYGGSEPLDATGLHPEQYPLVRRILDSAGLSLEQGLGRPGATKGLRRTDFDVDDSTWRDLMREIAFPGRDPRLRLQAPALLESETDPVRLVKDRVIEGIVSNVASFGTFVDVGLAQDAMIHISEISDRYVRDARELLSVGQTVRARILDGSGPRLSLSLRNVPWMGRDRGRDGGRERDGARHRDGPRDRGGMRGDARPREGGGDERNRRGGPGRERGGGRDEPKAQPFVRAAQTRRDGLGVRSGGGRGGGGRGAGRGGGGGGGRGGDRPGGPRGRGADRHEDGGEHVRLDALEPGRKPAFSPFASFFKAKQAEKPTEGS